jgi:hypothetical protein
MQPFVLAFDWGRPETLDARAAANLARMQKGAEELAKKRAIETAKKENRAINVDEIEYPDLLPIEKITIQFSKPLFEDLFIKGGSTYSFPTGMYAQMFHFARYQQTVFNNLKRKGSKNIPATLEHFENMDERQISAFARFARYIMSHNNLTAKQAKDKDYTGIRNINLVDMMSEVYPHPVNPNGRGERHVDMRKVTTFLDMVILIYYSIKGFLFYPVIRELTPKTLTLEIYTDPVKAEKALGLNSSAGEFIRNGLALPEPEG